MRLKVTASITGFAVIILGAAVALFVQASQEHMAWERVPDHSRVKPRDGREGIMVVIETWRNGQMFTSPNRQIQAHINGTGTFRTMAPFNQPVDTPGTTLGGYFNPRKPGVLTVTATLIVDLNEQHTELRCWVYRSSETLKPVREGKTADTSIISEHGLKSDAMDMAVDCSWAYKPV